MAFAHVASGTGTDQEMLDAVRAMIQRINVTGQEYRDQHGHMVRLPELSVLRQQEKDLQVKVDAASGPARNLVEFQRRP